MGGLFSTVMRSDMSVIEELIREFRAALEKGQWRVLALLLPPFALPPLPSAPSLSSLTPLDTSITM